VRGDESPGLGLWEDIYIRRLVPTKRLAGHDQRPVICLPPPTLENAPPHPRDEEPPASQRSGSPDDTLHPRALLDAHDQRPPCLPDPRPPVPVPNGQHLFCPKEQSKRDTPHGVGHPFSDSGVLPAPSCRVPEALHGPGQVHRWEDPPDESWEKLPGRPPDLEVSRWRHLLPPLWFGA